MDRDLDLALPATAYTEDDIQEDPIPSLAFAPQELGYLSLFPQMALLHTDDWSRQTFGYAPSQADGPHVYGDGRMENAAYPPDYYVYSPLRADTLESGFQAIEEFDWSATEGDAATPREAGHAEDAVVQEGDLLEQVPSPIASLDDNSSEGIDIVDADALNEPAPSTTSPVPDPVTGDNGKLIEAEAGMSSGARMVPDVAAKASDAVPVSMDTAEAVPVDARAARSPTSQSPFPASPSPPPTSVAQEAIQADHQGWKEQSKSASTAHASPTVESDSCPPTHPAQGGDPECDAQQSSLEVKTGFDGGSGPDIPTVESVEKSTVLANRRNPYSSGTALSASAIEKERIVDVSPPLPDTRAIHKPKRPRREARKSIKEQLPIGAMGDDEEAEEEKVERSSPRVLIDNVFSKAPEIYFEEDTRPSDNKRAALNHEDEDFEPSVDGVDDEMHEHFSDVQQTSTPSLPQSPYHTASSSGPQCPDATLAPGLHLGLQFQHEQIRAQAHAPVDVPIRNSNAGYSFLIVGDETPECEATPAENRKKRANTTKKERAPKRARTATKAQPMASHPKQKETVESEASNEDMMPFSPVPRRAKTATKSQPRLSESEQEQTMEPEAGEEDVELFPALRLEAKQTVSTQLPTPLTMKPVKRDNNTKKNATARTTRARKSRARTDRSDDDFTDAEIATVTGDDDMLFPEDNAHHASVPSTPKTKARSKPAANLVKQATPSAASSPRTKNKYGFYTPSPRKTRSAANAAASKGNANATPRTAKNKQPENASSAVPKNKTGSRAKTKAPVVHENAEADNETEHPRRSTRGHVTDAKHPVPSAELPRRSTRHTSTTAPDPPEHLRRSTRHASANTPDNDNDDAKPHVPVEQARRSTRHASTLPPADAVAGPKRDRGGRAEAEKRVTRRTEAAEMQEKERNIGKRLRSGD